MFYIRWLTLSLLLLETFIQCMYVRGALCSLAPLVQFKKQKTPMEECFFNLQLY